MKPFQKLVIAPFLGLTLVIALALPAASVVRWSSFNDTCSGMTLQSSPQGYSWNKSWKYGNTKLTNYKHWGYVDHPYYRRSWNTGFPETAQVYAEASLRWIDGAPYLTCY